jgi:hypothetical protein
MTTNGHRPDHRQIGHTYAIEQVTSYGGVVMLLPRLLGRLFTLASDLIKGMGGAALTAVIRGFVVRSLSCNKRGSKISSVSGAGMSDRLATIDIENRFDSTRDLGSINVRILQ